jgi:hypothetical protein
MRTTVELIEELEREARSFSQIALVVGFPEGTQFVWCSEGDKAEKIDKLNKLIEEGGEPVGLIGVNIAEDIGSYYLRPLREYKTNETTLTYLRKLQSVVARVLAAQGALLPDLHYAEGWIN